MENSRGMKIAVIVIIAVAIVAALLFWFFRPQAALPQAVAIDTSNQPTTGNLNSNIQIVAFEDFKCQNCMLYNKTLFPKIKAKYIDTGKIKYTVIPLAFIPGSAPAANTALCLHAQNPKLFFDFAHYVFAHQPPENEDWATIPTLLEFASHIPGIDQKKLEQCLIESPYNSTVTNNLNQAMKVMNGMVASPTLYVNGRIVQPLTMERIDALVNASR